MLFPEKLTKVPQPRRADLWACYLTLCTALALNVALRKEARTPTQEELLPLKQAATEANAILAQYGIEPSFFPQREDFFDLLTTELTKVANAPKRKD